MRAVNSPYRFVDRINDKKKKGVNILFAWELHCSSLLLVQCTRHRSFARAGFCLRWNYPILKTRDSNRITRSVRLLHTGKYEITMQQRRFLLAKRNIR